MGYLESALECIETTLRQIGSTLVYVVYVGIALEYNEFGSILVNIKITMGYFGSTLRYFESTLGYFGSTLGYIGITIECTGSTLEYVGSILRLDMLDMLSSMAYLAYTFILVNIMSTMG